MLRRGVPYTLSGYCAAFELTVNMPKTRNRPVSQPLVCVYLPAAGSAAQHRDDPSTAHQCAGTLTGV